MKLNKKIVIPIVVCAVIAVAVVFFIAFGSAKKTEKETTQAQTTTNQPETTTKDPNAGKIQSKLTGEYVSKKIANKRPVALMYNNIINAIPHSGLSNADVCYEAPVEGSITRIMGIFENYSKLKKMGSVRSCRIYYCGFANEWDAIYSHFGQSKYALEYLKSGSIDTVNSFNSGNAFFRTTDRVAPHNCFISGKSLQNEIAKKKYRTTYKKNFTQHFQFNENTFTPNTKKVANKVEIGYRINAPWFTFNKKDGQYYRYQYNKKHIDDQNNKQLHCSNIIIQFVNYTLYPDNKSLDMTLTGSGSGWYITKGKAMKLTWSKSDKLSGQTEYYNSKGEKIKLNKGKTWICVVGNEDKDRVKISK